MKRRPALMIGKTRAAALLGALALASAGTAYALSCVPPYHEEAVLELVRMTADGAPLTSPYEGTDVSLSADFGNVQLRFTKGTTASWEYYHVAR